ncbi:hypothetical protein [Rhodanobacter soli]|uniref:Uncharacterized protein n=1 Tax=Rhodanobacter soli TaxID=590609 RepID=A0ABV2PZZ6_9GAMM
MATNMKKAQELLFDSLGATNFKMYPGFSRDSTPEEIAGEISNAIEQISGGDFDEVALV